MRKRPPILVDTSLHVAFAIKYAIYAMFGLLAAVFGAPTLERVAGSGVTQVIGAVILIASVASGFSTLRSPGSVIWEKVELYSTITVVSFVSVYCTFAGYLAAVHESDDYLSRAVLAAALLVFPLWRIIQIIKGFRD